MAAGEGTRLRPLTERWPKPVLPIDGRPVLVSAADTVYRRGDVARFAAEFAASGAAGAVAVRTDPPPGPGRQAIRRNGALIEAIGDEDPENPWSAAPLWAVGPAVAERLCLDNPPYELEHAFQSAIDAGETVMAVEIGKTRDLTYPVDLVEENFPYLRAT